jgi:hypothetical protein
VASRAEEAWRLAQRGPIDDSLDGSLGDNSGQPA